MVATTIPASDPSNGWVAFTAVPLEVSPSPDGAPADIYLVREGEVVRPIVGSLGDGWDQFCPAFSPDGSRLAYVELPYWYPDEPQPDGPDAPPERSAIVISGFNGDGSLSGPETIIDLGHPDERTTGLLAGMSCPEWSPDGSMLAYLTGDIEEVGDHPKTRKKAP